MDLPQVVVPDRPLTQVDEGLPDALCGYIYDEKEEKESFSDLPDEWVCPVCGAEKELFYKL